MSMSLDQEISFRGYDEVKEIFKPSESLDSTLEKIDSLDRINTVYSVAKMPEKEAFKDTIIFYKEMFNVHDILFYDIRKFFKKRYAIVKRISPYKLPLHFFDSEDIFDGSAVEHLVSDDNGPLVTFRSIMLSKPFTEHTPISYTHEFMHTQIDSLYGCVTNYFDAEVLSIFIELVFTYYISKDGRLLNLEDSRRIQEMKLMNEILKMYLESGTLKQEYRISTDGRMGDEDSSLRAEMLQNTKYLVSDLKAYNLFGIFYYGSEKVKLEMMKMLQRVLDGELTLSDYLNKYEVDLESSQDEKRLMKYFGRK